jgi:hypothetical protein
MKLILGTTLVLLLAGAPAYSGQEPDKDKPKEEPKPAEKNKKGKQDEPKSQEKPKQEPDKRPEVRDRAKPSQQSDRPNKEQEERNRNQQKAQPPDRAQDQQRARETEQHSDRGHGRRVPEVQFHASFGREHHFHVQRREDRRFQYSGFWFTYYDPWPGDWDYNDDVYIDEIDGEYYLFNPRRPGVRILVIVAD